MKNIWIIMRKELRRVFFDRRLFFSSILLPGLLIFLLYTIMGNAIQGQFSVSEDTKFSIVIENVPLAYQSKLDTLDKFEIVELSTQEAKDKIYAEELDALVVFPINFEENVSNSNTIPNVEIYYNSSNVTSQSAYGLIVEQLQIYHSELMETTFGKGAIFDINKSDNNYQLVNEEKANSKFIAMLLPFLIITFLFSAAMSVAPESIAGEKERGTIATLLVTPVKRRDIAIGKIFSLSILTSLSAISSFIGTILSMPALTGVTGVSYSITDYLFILLLIISAVILITGVIALISSFSKNIREASTLCSPIMILSMVIGITSMFGSSAPTNSFLYLIPMYNCVQSLGSIFNMQLNAVNLSLTILSNFAYAAILLYALTKSFNSEKMMFRK